MDTPDVPHTPKYLDGGAVAAAAAATNKSAFVELQQHGLVSLSIYLFAFNLIDSLAPYKLNHGSQNINNGKRLLLGVLCLRLKTSKLFQTRSNKVLHIWAMKF